MSIQSQMPTDSKNLRQSLLASHLSVAVLGVLLLLGALTANLWLRDSAVHLATISGPRSEVVVQLQAGMQQALANLRGWIALGETEFKQNRRLTWDEVIHPGLEKMAHLSKLDNRTDNSQYLSLLEIFHDLEMWQWRIEDIAQSPGNFPARIILKNQILPQLLQGTSAVTALIELTLVLKEHQGLSFLIKLRENWHLADRQLNSYIISNINAEYNEYQRLINIAISAQRDYQNSTGILERIASNQSYQEQVWQDQFNLITDSFKTYQMLAIEAVDIRQSEQSNIANYLLKKQSVPLVTHISALLQNMSNTEQTIKMKDVKKVQLIGNIVPWVMLVLMVLMMLLALYLAHKGIRKFLLPVLELERRNKMKADLAQLNEQMHGTDNIPSLTEQIIGHLCLQVNAAAGAIYIVNDQTLCPKASYVLAMDELPQHLACGEQLVGQAWKNALPIELNASTTGLTIQSPLLSVIPRSVLAIPVSFEDQVIAVIELLSLETFDANQREFLDKAAIQIGIALHTIFQSVRIHKSLLETQNQAAELQAQQEELVSSNEELSSRSEELQAQQEELRLSNDELSIRSDELEQARIEAEEKARKLDETSRYKSEFLANMSHELRTPLNSILILANDLSNNDDGNLSDDERESASVIEDSGKNLLNLINDILDISKVEAGQMNVMQDMVSLKELSKQVQRNFKPIAKQQGVSFTSEITDKLPDLIESDSIKLNQILTNLISNALKFTHEGGVTLRISRCSVDDIMQQVSERLPENLISFAVEDSGIGIPENKQTLIFQAFQQADGSTTRTYGGTGLGLSIALNFAHLLGGDIRLHSKEGKGSTFTLYLPLIESQLTTDTEATIEITECVDQTTSSLIEDCSETVAKILVVEDDLVAQMAITKLLGDMSIETTQAQTSQEILELLSKNRFEIMLLDLGLPGIGGCELLENIAADTTIKIPKVIIYTGKELSTDEQTRLSVYTDKIIIKSADSEERLLNEINLFLRHFNSPSPTNSKAPDHSIDLSDTKVLLVDDDMRNLFALSKVLTKQGMKVKMTPSGNNALEILDQAESYDLVLMDIMMPGMDGYQTMQEIRKRPQLKDLPIIALTAKAMPGDKEKCLRAGANDYLPKPIDTSKLMTLIQLWV